MIAVALVVAALLTVLAGLLRAGATSLQRITRASALHDAAEGVAGASRVAEVLEDEDVVAPAVNVVHSMLLLAAVLPAAWAIQILVEGPRLAVLLPSLGAVLLVVGDLVPRGLARTRRGALAYRLALLLAVAVAAGRRVAGAFREDAEEVVHENGTEDDDDADEIELITSVLEFSETIVREVMVPRPDMVVVSADAPIADLLRLVDEHGYSRLPVIGESLDDVRGMVIVKDLLPRLTSDDPPRTVSDVLRPVDFVPETKRVPELLKEMQASKSHMAVVVDEYGGTAGLVTIEDLLEEIVGEIVDEYDEDELLVREQPDGTWRVDGRLPVAELSDVVGSDLPDDGWDTVGGLVLGLAGRVPREGEQFAIDGLVLTVGRVAGRRVSEVHVAPARAEAAVEDSG